MPCKLAYALSFLGEPTMCCNPILLASTVNSSSQVETTFEEEWGMLGDGILQPHLKYSEALGNLAVFLGYLDEMKCKWE